MHLLRLTSQKKKKTHMPLQVLDHGRRPSNFLHDGLFALWAVDFAACFPSRCLVVAQATEQVWTPRGPLPRVVCTSRDALWALIFCWFGAWGRWTPRWSHLGTPHKVAGWGRVWSTSLCHCKQPPARGISASKAARPCPKQVLCFGSNSKEDWSGYQQPNSLLKQKTSVSKQITTLLFLLS